LLQVDWEASNIPQYGCMPSAGVVAISVSALDRSGGVQKVQITIL